MSGIVYILTNPEMRGLVKIGKTDNLEQRLRELYKTSVPVPFECHFACEVENPDTVEKQLHEAFGDHRINQKREFFRISPERVKAALALAPAKDVTPGSDIVEDEIAAEALENSRRRRPLFRFLDLNIQKGAKLQFIRNESYTCCVVDDRKVEFEGQEDFLSPVTVDLLNSKFGTNRKTAQGPDYWLYKGELLTERRERLEKEEREEGDS
ncbi:MAG: GIY-YIG nuclease family protein [Rhodospirillales bacterium]